MQDAQQGLKSGLVREYLCSKRKHGIVTLITRDAFASPHEDMIIFVKKRFNSLVLRIFMKLW